MKRALTTISVLIMIATISTSAHAGGFWNFMNNVFAGTNVPQRCDIINASDPLQAATLTQAARGANLTFPPAVATPAAN